ncbi:MAG TPA: glutamine synthetase family protein [Polyangiaceae bacterium]|jgi:glutamine synthetase|nr:glutamine synthetase family protein [Polyangiaceae bacterium]
MDAKELKEAFEKQGIRRVKVGGFDLDGVLRGKYIALDKFWGALSDPIGFCDVIFGWDAADVLYDNSRITGWHTGYPDTHARLDPATFRVLPWEPDTAAFLLDFVDHDGAAHPACPRNLLKKVIARAKSLGYDAVLAAEFEFFVFKESPASLREKGFRKLEPLSPGMFGYSWVREGQHADLCHAILDDMERFDIPIEGLHTETGPGVYEAAIAYDEALRAADKAALFKTAMKQIASKLGYSVTFMAKWNHALPGSSGHIHQSLWKGGKNVFFDAAAPDKLSEAARHYLGGQVALMPELTALVSPTINSYKRYVPGVWAPLNASWGIENRTCAIRAIPGSAKSTRLENRQAAADINPYVAMASSLAAGLWGLEHKAEAPTPVEGDASARGDLARLPTTLREATTRLEESKHARDLLGAPFVDHYVLTRDWECRQYDRAVTEWELERYFETV